MAYRTTGPIVSRANYGMAFYRFGAGNPNLSGLGAMRRRRGMRGLGQPPGYADAATALNNAIAQTSMDAGFTAGQEALLAANTPQSPGALAQQGPTAQSLTNLLTSMSPPTDPLSFVSPQAAIAAGLDPTTVYDAWTQAMAQFPTQNAALAAGVPAGVVTQLWTASRALVPAAPTIDLTTWLWIGGGVAVLLLLGGKGK